MKTVRRLYWSAARFIPAPWPGDAPKVFANAIPKSGTHLLERALCLHPQISRVFRKKLFSANIAAHGGWEENIARIARGKMLLVHADYAPVTHDAIRTHDVRNILMVRDPRAIVLSQARYILGNERHEFHRHVRGRDLDYALDFCLHEPVCWGGMTFIETCCRYWGWSGHGDVLIVRYEDLASPDLQKRTEEIARLYGFLFPRTDDRLVQRIARKAVSAASQTFHSGIIDGWRDGMAPALAEKIYDYCADHFACFGYHEAGPG